MPIPTVVTDLSATAASNSPSATDTPGEGDDHIRALAAFIRQSYDGTLTAYVKVTSDGRLYGTALHNNAGAVTGTTNQYVASGTYTPTLTNTTNIAASTANLCHWIRVGNVVHVAGTVDLDPTAASTLTTLDISLPIASSFAVSGSLAGTAVRSLNGAVYLAATVLGNAVDDKATLQFYNDTDVGNRVWRFTFSYVVL